MDGLLGTRLLHSGGEVPTSSLAGVGVVALYFSAHWCGPCQAYTPELGKVYRRVKAKGKSFEVIFVSRDRDEASFAEYFRTMPWYAIPFSDTMRREVLCNTFQVRGIPSLVLVSGTGNLMDPNARAKVMLPSFPSTLPRVADVEDIGPVPIHPMTVVVRYRGEVYELEECDPEEGWDMLRIKIFSITGVPEEQQRLFGFGAVRGQIDDSQPLARALAGGIRAQKGSGLRFAEVPEDRRTASSAFNNDQPGAGLNRGALGSAAAWAPLKEDKAPWYQFDLGAVTNVAGLALAPRRDAGEWVERFRVTRADAEAGPWTPVEGGREFAGCETFPQQTMRVVFAGPVSARFVRIEPTKFARKAALRADVLLQDGAKPDEPPTIVVLGNASAGDPFECRGPNAAEKAPQRMVEEQHLAMLQAKMSSLPPRLQNEARSVDGARRYEDRTLQRHALDEVPVCSLDQLASAAAAASGDKKTPYEVAFMRSVLQWFKHAFFEWTNTPKCEHCGSSDTKSAGRGTPNQVEQQFGAGVIELVQCGACGLQTRYPRYNDPGKLLESRSGRCGEWANCFTLVCRALGYEARLVHDWTDHVWTEVYFDALERWAHLDSCEAALDTPLVYEKGWGKKLTYCLAYARDHAVDVTRRYTRKYEEVLTRRGQFSEQDLKRAMTALNSFAMDRAICELPQAVGEQRRVVLEKRMEREASELEEFARMKPEGAKAEEQVGRTSGDAEWREQRGELGADAAARGAALRLSEQGLAGAWSSAADAKEVLVAKFRELVEAGTPAGDAAAICLEPLRPPHAAAVQVRDTHDRRSEEDWRSLIVMGPLEEDLHSIWTSIRWRDQGYGNSKGRVRAVLRRGETALGEIDCFGLAPQATAGSRTHIEAIAGAKPVKGDSVVFEYKVGGGGGHELHIDSFEAGYCTAAAAAEARANAKKKYEQHISAGSSPEEAAAALLSDDPPKASCAVPPAAATPAAASAAPTVLAPGASQAELRAFMARRHAELVQGGMAANEAAAKLLDEVKRLQSAGRTP